MALRYTIGEERGRTFAENLAVIETAAPNQVYDRKATERVSDPVDELEREWGLRRQ